MSKIENYKELSCCSVKITNAELWILKDFKGYTKRKLLIGRCQKCGDEACLQIITKADTDVTYFNLYNGIEAVKTIYRERKRVVSQFPNIKTNTLWGWIYGHNTQIKNKKGEVTQIRQYASDFKQKRSLVKKIKI